MSVDQFTRVSSTSWFGRIGNAFKGVVIGLVLFVIAFPLLWWNEGRAIRTYKSLKEGAGAVVSVAADLVDPANEGKLVHTSGRAETLETIADAGFAVSAPALKLRRQVEMYQWVEKKSSETRKKLGGGEETVTTYRYEKKWGDDLVDSARFEEPQGHRNPERMEYRSDVITAGRVTLGDFTLSASLLDKLNQFNPLALAADYAVPAALGDRVRRTGEGLYVGRDPERPEVGDLRITFGTVPPQEVSVVSRQVGQTFAPYQAKAGGVVELLQCGVVTAADMFQHAQDVNKMITWLVRLGGFLLMWIGVAVILKPLSVLADVVPLIGSIVGFGVGLLAGVVAGVCSLTTIAVAWLAYRPVLAGVLIAGSVGLLFLLRRRRPSAVPRAA